MTITKGRIFLVFLSVMVSLFCGCIDNPQKPVATTTTISPYLRSKYYCENESDCRFRCGNNPPILCENTYWIEHEKNTSICNLDETFSGPSCLCNISINKCYLTSERIRGHYNKMPDWMIPPERNLTIEDKVHKALLEGRDTSSLKGNIVLLLRFNSTDTAFNFKKKFVQKVIDDGTNSSTVRFVVNAREFFYNISPDCCYLNNIANEWGLEFMEPVIEPISFYDSEDYSNDMLAPVYLTRDPTEEDIKQLKALRVTINNPRYGTRDLYGKPGDIKNVANLTLIMRVYMATEIVFFGE